MSRRRLALLFGMVVCLGAAGPTQAAVAAAPPPSASCYAGSAPVFDTPPQLIRAAVVCLVNQQRLERGLPALRESAELDRSAQDWTDTMIRTGQFDHGRDLPARVSATGFQWSWVGEDIATGWVITPWMVVQAWMASPEHCRNILSPRWSRIGTGVYDRRLLPQSIWGATWTADFALPLASRPPSRRSGPAAGCPYAL